MACRVILSPLWRTLRKRLTDLDNISPAHRRFSLAACHLMFVPSSLPKLGPGRTVPASHGSPS